MHPQPCMCHDHNVEPYNNHLENIDLKNGGERNTTQKQFSLYVFFFGNEKSTGKVKQRGVLLYSSLTPCGIYKQKLCIHLI